MDVVDLNEEEKELLEKAASQRGMTIDKYMEAATGEQLKARFGKPKTTSKANKKPLLH